MSFPKVKIRNSRQVIDGQASDLSQKMQVWVLSMELRLVSVSEEEERGQKDKQEAVRDARVTYEQWALVCSVQGGAWTEQFILQKVGIIGNIYVKDSDKWNR